ncbi:hypothetical protein MMC27_005121 [Xylographa pallens]|nr:hypothetical protein [Xylographa pallens]
MGDIEIDKNILSTTEGDLFYDSDASYTPESKLSSGESDTEAGRTSRELRDLRSYPLRSKSGGGMPRTRTQKPASDPSSRPSLRHQNLLDLPKVEPQSFLEEEGSRSNCGSLVAKSNQLTSLSTGSANVVDKLTSSTTIYPISTEPKSSNIGECGPDAVRTRTNLSQSRAAVPDTTRQEQDLTIAGSAEACSHTCATTRRYTAEFAAPRKRTSNSNKSSLPRYSLSARPTRPHEGANQLMNILMRMPTDSNNGRGPRSPSIAIPATTKPTPASTEIIPGVRRKRKLSSEDTEEVVNKKPYDRVAPSTTSDRAKPSVGQDTVQPRPKVPQKEFTTNPSAKSGKRSIHYKAKVNIDLYIKNKESTFILWSFGKLHDSTFEDICSKIAAEYERPIGSIVFDIIAGGTVTSVEIERGGDIEYQRLDEKLGNVVRTCKHGGTIRINADPQTPEDADPCWEYDPL